MTLLFESMIGRPTIEFVDWFDRTYRAMYDHQCMRRRWFDSSFDEAWQMLQMQRYQNGAVAEDWNSLDHLLSATYLTLYRMRQTSCTQGKAPTHSRGIVADGRYARLFSELGDHALQAILMRPVVERQKSSDELSPAVGWLTKLIEELSPRRRQAIELCVVGGYSVNEAAKLVGSTKNAVNKARHNALAQLRLRAEGVDVKHVNGYVQAAS